MRTTQIAGDVQMQIDYCVELLSSLGARRNSILKRVKLTYWNRKKQCSLWPGIRSLDTIPSNRGIANVMKSNELLRKRICEEIVCAYLDEDPSYYDSIDKAPPLSMENYPGVLAVYLFHLPDSDKEIEMILEKHRQIQEESAKAKELDVLTKDSPDPLEDQNPHGDSLSGTTTYQSEERMQSDESLPTTTQQKGDTMSESGTITLVGQIEFISQRSSFYCNFVPIYQVDGSRLTAIDKDERLDRFPHYGNLQFMAENYYLQEKLTDKQIWTLSLSEDQLNRYKQSGGSTLYRIDFIFLQRNNCLKPVTQIGYYPIIKTSNDQTINFDDRRVPVDAYDIAPCEKALIQEGDKLYGPYKVETRNGQFHAIIPEEKDQIIPAHVPRYGDIESNCITLSEDVSYIHFESTCDTVLVDKMSVSKLVEVFANQIKTTSTNQDDLNISSQDFINSQSDPTKEEIWNARREQLITLLSNRQRWLDASNDVISIFSEIFRQYGNEQEVFEPFVEKLLEMPQVTNSLPMLTRVRKEIEDQQNTLNKLRQEAEEIRSRTQAENEKQAEEDLSEKIIQLQQEKRQLETEINQLREDESLGKDCKAWYGARNVYRNDAKKAQDELKKAREEKEKIQSTMGAEVEQTLSKAKSQTAEIAFNGMIAEKMLHAAAEWSKHEEEKRYEDLRVKENEELQLVSEDELVSYLCQMVQRYRPDYSNNEIINIFICISQNFITVFSGEPGTGKTSICNIIAHIMGLSSFENNYCNRQNNIYCNRYIPVSVEKGWTSKRDFIGYYNPLSQKFEKANSQLVDGFSILNAEAKAKKANYPYLILLDEANLSPMEYYWADFMNICDSDNTLNSISLGNDIQLQIPNVLRFVATINNDHTTEVFSPRLIDRAAVIVLPDVPYKWIPDESLKNKEGIRIVAWESFSNVFSKGSDNCEIPADILKLYERIKEKLKSIRLRISPRTEKAIMSYWCVAQRLFESGPEMSDTGRLALDYAIAQNILPKINGSGEEYSRSLKDLQEFFTAGNLLKCADILDLIIQRGQDSMNYYQFF